MRVIEGDTRRLDYGSYILLGMMERWDPFAEVSVRCFFGACVSHDSQ